MSSSTTSSSPTSFWIGKSSSHKLWHHVNDYVSDYTSEHQSELESDWFRKWYFLIHDIKISDKSREFQVIALSITGNPDATIDDCLNTILDLVPSLRQYFTVLERTDKGTLKCKLGKYTFSTPKERNVTKSPQRLIPKQRAGTKVQANRYAALATYDDTFEPSKETLPFSDMALPVEQEIIMEQHSTSTLSHETKTSTVHPKNIKTDIALEAKRKDPSQSTMTQFMQEDHNEPTKPSPFGRFRNTTKNALHNVAIKAKDFATDKDFTNMLNNNAFVNSVKSSPLFQHENQQVNEIID